LRSNRQQGESLLPPETFGPMRAPTTERGGAGPAEVPPAGGGAMRAAVLRAPGAVALVPAPVPVPGPGEVRVRLAGCGVCASNVPPYEGRPWFSYPFAPGDLGHEGWGWVDAAGPGVRGLARGQPVAALSYRAYAEYDLAPATQVLPLPDALAGHPFPGEPLGCALNVYRRAAIRPRQWVAVVGAGFLGALLIQLASTAGARVIALARSVQARARAARMGADYTAAPDEDAVARIEAWTAGALCPRVIEVTGAQAPLDLAGRITAVRGRLVVAGFHQDGPRQVDLSLWNWRGLDVVNAHERHPARYMDGMRQAVEAVREGRLDPAPLYTHRLPLERLGEALELARTRPPGFVKALVLTGAACA
jgi:threonine dehydrogenase-like Zn-dependent dehydrogenase